LVRLGRTFHATPEELMDRLTVAQLVEQIAFDALEAEEAEEWRQRQPS